jgi:alkanesulfonate monooxygenase SsuD/methylene tetrahydromethanopterin reductase-like flavin-dependent oxidoreductase (luciferase family)
MPINIALPGWCCRIPTSIRKRDTSSTTAISTNSSSAAELGFDGISVNEHHQNAYGLMPSPVVMASALARRTKHAKIAILGNAFCLREHPLTLAEEHAMLDCITGGRLISGMVRGHRRRILLDGRQSGLLSMRVSRRRMISSCKAGPAPVRSLSRASSITSST